MNLKSPGENQGNEVVIRCLNPTILEDYPRLESLMSCSVCYETIQDPILTRCSHSFCSLCIRRYMLYKLQCPACFTELHEKDLTPNKPLRDVLDLLSLNKIRDDLSSSTDCNICGVSVLSSKFEAHSIQCSNSPSKPLSSSSSTTTTSSSMKPISKPVYHLLKDSELKKKMKELGLCIKGDRKTLVSRHQRFIVIWNTECSKENPLTKLEIVSLLQREETNELKMKKSDTFQSALTKYDRNSDPKLIEAKQKEILSANKDSFQELIASIKNKQGSKPIHQENGSQKNEEVPISLSQELHPPSSPVATSPTLITRGELYVTPKRKILNNSLVDSGKKMKQNSVKSLFEKTERRKVNCPSCNELITATFLNIHLDRCLEVETPSSAATDNGKGDEDFVPLVSLSNTTTRKGSSRRLRDRK